MVFEGLFPASGNMSDDPNKRISREIDALYNNKEKLDVLNKYLNRKK